MRPRQRHAHHGYGNYSYESLRRSVFPKRGRRAKVFQSFHTHTQSLCIALYSPIVVVFTVRASPDPPPRFNSILHRMPRLKYCSISILHSHHLLLCMTCIYSVPIHSILPVWFPLVEQYNSFTCRFLFFAKRKELFLFSFHFSLTWWLLFACKHLAAVCTKYISFFYCHFIIMKFK